MALTTLTTGMAQADFLSALNGNYAYLLTLCNKVAMSVVTIDDAKVGQPLLDDLNNNFKAYDANYKADHITLTIGMTNEAYIRSLNANFQAIEDKVNEWSLIAAYANSLAKTQTNDISVIGSTGSALYGSASYAPNGKIYAGPYGGSGNILCIDTADDSISYIGSGLGNTNGSVYCNGYVFFFPIDNTHHIIVLNTTTHAITTIGTTQQDCIRGVEGPNGKVYTIAYGSPGQCFEIDPVGMTITAFGSFNGTYRGLVNAPDGTILAMPYSGSTSGIMRINPWTHAITYFGTVNNGHWGGAISPVNSKIYSFPIEVGTDTTVYKIDADTGTVSTFGTVDSHLMTFTGPNGKIYSLPYNTGICSVVNPSNDSIAQFQFDAGGYPHKYGGVCVAPNGHAYAIPNGYGDIVKLFSPLTIDSKFCLSRFFNNN